MVRLDEHKHETENKPIENAPLPARVYIPLSQHIGKPCNPLVKIGDTVSVGQKIAGLEAQLHAPIHASISGKISSIQGWPHPVLGKCKAIVIDAEGENQCQVINLKPQSEIEKLTPEQIRNIIFEAGIVGMGGAGFPTYVKLTPQKPVDTLIINGAECEPYLTADYRLMVEKTDEIILGIILIARCLGAKKVYIGIEDNKPLAIEAFKDKTSGLGFEVKVLKSFYPQGGEKQLIKNFLRKEVPSGKLPFEVGVVVQNVGTVFAIYEAAYLNKPLYERVVTVIGSCISNPKNLLVRIGTPIKNLIEFCGPLKEEPAKIITGGPMMGIAQYTDIAPVIKSSTGIILMNKKEANEVEEQCCIRCGACVRECPAGLMPCLLNLVSEKGRWQEAKDYGVSDCIECGLCNYVCPANRRIVQTIKRAKLEAK